MVLPRGHLQDGIRDSAARSAVVIEKTHTIDGDDAVGGGNLALSNDGRFTDATGGIATSTCASNTRLGAKDSNGLVD